MAEPVNARPGAGESLARPRRRRWLPWLILLAVAAAIAFALFRPKATVPAHHGRHGAGHAGPAGAAGARPQPVSVATVQNGDMPVTLTQLGTVTPLATITVQSQISGYLLQVNFREGQEVKKGDQLALVDPRLYQATLTQSEGNLVRDQALLKQALADDARYTLLLKQKSIAAQTAQNQQYVVGEYQGAVLTDQGQIASAKQNIAYCHIISPIDGRVGLRQVDAGNYITSGETNGLVVVTQLRPISVIFSIPQADIPEVQTQLAAGSTLPVQAWDSADTAQISAGSVETIDNTIDTSTGTVRVRANFANDDEQLFPNQFVNAHLLLKTLHDVALIPNSAIQTGPNGPFAYLVKPDMTVAVAPLKLGTANGTETVVLSGLHAGDRVVTDGTDRLKAGSKVAIPTQQPGSTPPTGAHPHHDAQADKAA